MKTVKSAMAVSDTSKSNSKGIHLLFWSLLGLVVPRGMLYGELAPFGIALASALPGGMFPVLPAIVGGYLLGTEMLYPLRYIGAVGVVFGARWVLGAVPELNRKGFVPPILAFIATLVTGVAVFSPLGLDGARILLLVAESAVAAVSSFFFSLSMEWGFAWLNNPLSPPPLTFSHQTAWVFVGAVSVMAISTLTVGDFSPGRSLAVVTVLLLARTGAEAGGSIAGTLLGATLALSSPGQTVPAIALAFGGLIAGVFSRFGKWTQSAFFLIGAGAVTLMENDETMLVHFGEMALGAGLFCLLPRKWEQPLAHFFLRGREDPAVEGMRRALGLRLQVAGQALGDVGETVSEVAQRLNQVALPNDTALFRRLEIAVCQNCSLYTFCWEQNRTALQEALQSLYRDLDRNEGTVSRDLTGFLAEQCRQKEKLSVYCEEEYTNCICQQGAWARLEELQQAVGEQFSGMNAMLTGLTGDILGEWQVETELSGKIRQLCEDYGVKVTEVLCFREKNHRLRVEIVAEDDGIFTPQGKWLREASRLLNCPLESPAITPLGEKFQVTLTEPARFTVEAGVCVLCCPNEKLCGDAVDGFSAHGCTVYMLSDGMGCGGRAAVDGAMTVGLTARLWKAGFSMDSILHTVNGALMMKSKEESLATLDMAIIDEYTGRLVLFKAGAAPSLLRSGGQVSRLEASSVPMGILPQVESAVLTDRLGAGDWLILMSDGALSSGMATVERLVAEYPRDGDMTVLAQTVATAIREKETRHPDDISVIALRLAKTP